MIEVTIRHSAATFISSGVVLDVRDRVESAAAKFFEEEQEHVDVTLALYSVYDEHGRLSNDEDILVKVDIDAGDVHNGSAGKAADLAACLREEFHEIFGAHAPRPRVWVRPIVGGSFAE